MAKRGPKPNDRVVVVPAKGIPGPPDYLDKPARAHWVALAALLNEAGYGSALDVDAMAAYVTHWSRWRAAEAKLAEPPDDTPGGDGGGLVVIANNGFRQLSPYYTVAKESLKEMKSYLAEFGLSPKARAKLVLPEPEEVDEKWQAFE